MPLEIKAAGFQIMVFATKYVSEDKAQHFERNLIPRCAKIINSKTRQQEIAQNKIETKSLTFCTTILRPVPLRVKNVVTFLMPYSRVPAPLLTCIILIFWP